MDDSALAMMTDVQLIAMLQRRGYTVRHNSESRQPLSWNRLEPIPAGVDFRMEAAEKIRAMITADMLSFSKRPYQTFDPGGEAVDSVVHTAVLRIL